MSFDEGAAAVHDVAGARWRMAVEEHGDLREAATRELADVLFASFPRRDQRRKGELYLLGSLKTQGRKSIRNIAAHMGGSAAEQSMHHFISSSTWDWKPVREALASHLSRLSPPQAWVVHPMPIPKAGDLSVGVDQVLDPVLGTFRGQRAFGVWYASESLNTPVSWRLFLPDSWLRDETRRRQAEIPDGAGEETLEECAVEAVLDVLGSWKVPPRPVVLNAHVGHVTTTMGRFTRAGIPVIARVGDTVRFVVHDPALPGHAGGRLTAQQIAVAARGLRRRVGLTERSGVGAGSPGTLAVALSVEAVGPAAGRRRAGTGEEGGELVLLAEWHGTRSVPDALWVTNMTSMSTGALLRMAGLGGRSCRELAASGAEMGLRDFKSRSFNGWHRHITLASAAHAVSALIDAASRPSDYAHRSA
ncbi:IS701 family transposase [Streptomyces sp. NPDC059568]|uniref:IS701 family transposase n=1 Tax=Streptomyces sp. NPDC059568 TaxID=3346868 RepID=UPI00368DB0E5